MISGRLDKQITIKRIGSGQDSLGQPNGSLSTVATVWANIKPIGGREKLRAGAIESTISHTIQCNYSADLLPAKSSDDLRITYGSRTFRVVSARDVDEAHMEIIFDCEES